MTFHLQMRVFGLIMANHIIFAIVFLTIGCYLSNGM